MVMAMYITSPLGVKNLRKNFPKEENRSYDVYHSENKMYWFIDTEDERIIEFMNKRVYPHKPYYHQKERK